MNSTFGMKMKDTQWGSEKRGALYSKCHLAPFIFEMKGINAGQIDKWRFFFRYTLV